MSNPVDTSSVRSRGPKEQDTEKEQPANPAITTANNKLSASDLINLLCALHGTVVRDLEVEGACQHSPSEACSSHYRILLDGPLSCSALHQVEVKQESRTTPSTSTSTRHTDHGSGCVRGEDEPADRVTAKLGRADLANASPSASSVSLGLSPSMRSSPAVLWGISDSTRTPPQPPPLFNDAPGMTARVVIQQFWCYVAGIVYSLTPGRLRLSPSEVESHFRETLQHRFQGDGRKYQVHYLELLTQCPGFSTTTSTSLFSPKTLTAHTADNEKDGSGRKRSRDASPSSTAVEERKEEECVADPTAPWRPHHISHHLGPATTTTTTTAVPTATRGKGVKIQDGWRLQEGERDAFSEALEEEAEDWTGRSTTWRREMALDAAPYFQYVSTDGVADPLGGESGFSLSSPTTSGAGGGLVYGGGGRNWSTDLSPAQLAVLNELRHRVLPPETLQSLLQQFTLVDGGKIFFHDVNPETMVECNGVQAGPYRTVIFTPVSLMTMKRCITESYHLQRRRGVEQSQQRTSTGPINPRSFLTSSTSIGGATPAAATAVAQDSVRGPVPPPTPSSSLAATATVLRMTGGREAPSSYDHGRGITHGHFTGGQNQSGVPSSLSYGTYLTLSGSVGGVVVPHSPTGAVSPLPSTEDDLDSYDGGGATTTESLSLELRHWDLELCTLIDLERMIWHIAANCVLFNAPETLFRITATRFATACSAIVQRYCMEQVHREEVMHTQEYVQR